MEKTRNYAVRRQSFFDRLPIIFTMYSWLQWWWKWNHLNGFLTASHVVVEDFAEYNNNNFLSKHEYPFHVSYIVHPSYQDDARKSHEVGTVVESFFGEYESASIDVALVQTKERVTKGRCGFESFNSLPNVKVVLFVCMQALVV